MNSQPLRPDASTRFLRICNRFSWRERVQKRNLFSKKIRDLAGLGAAFFALGQIFGFHFAKNTVYVL
jgi:hypothetical protein